MVFRFFYFINRCNVICWYLFKVINGHRFGNDCGGEALDCRNTSGNDGREEGIASNKFFKYPSPDTNVSTSPSGDEVIFNVINWYRLVNLKDCRNTFGNDGREGVAGNDRKEKYLSL